MLKLASDGIISFSTKPLKIVGGLGLISIFLSILILIYALLSFVFSANGPEPGWTSIMVAQTFFSGVIMLAIWILAEYIARIYDESKMRPQYIIKETINIDSEEQ